MKSGLRFVITSHKRLPGVRLSLAGQFGGIEYPGDHEACQAAHEKAAGQPYTIERESLK